jgi:hypothetical protein
MNMTINTTAYETTAGLFAEFDNATEESAKIAGALDALVALFGLPTVTSALADCAQARAGHAHAAGNMAQVRKLDEATNALNRCALSMNL